MDGREQGEALFTVRDEDSEILKKDGELDEEDLGDVDDYGDVKPLIPRSAGSNACVENIDYT